MATIQICIGCAVHESAKRPGALYQLRSDRDEPLVAWICNECAIPLGPPQGTVVPYKKGMKTSL